MTSSAATATESLEAGWRAALTREDIDRLLELDDLRSWLSLALNWALVFASFALVAYWPNPLTILLALFVIGARQLGFAVLMHEASHRTLFRNRRLNDAVGNWLCAYPIWSDLHPYRPYHLQHHAKTGSAADPDIGLVRPFPISGASLRRKVWRDLSGQTGRKFARGAWRRTFGHYRQDPIARRAAQGVVITNLALLGLLWAVGRPELYLLWVAAWFTTHTLVTRIRSIAEHALTPDPEDPLGNTRTTLASGWERLFLAPNRVNYHLEHHLLMTVPHYKLPDLHRLLRERGVLDRACVERGYWRVLQRAASRPASGGGSRGDEETAGLSQVNGL
ncbi:MAG: fatty acid desaturase family protein [Deltaproteobacteria bacterium]|nr:MAG: fatty acid desaturase family protein [Deltaproteobacteria bacterium]